MGSLKQPDALAAGQRRILIIGNSDGIGAAVTELLVARGDHVVGISRSRSPLGSSGPRHEIQDVTAPAYRDLLTRLLAEEGSFRVTCRMGFS